MTSWWFKSLGGLVVAVLVGCATSPPLPTAAPQPPAPVSGSTQAHPAPSPLADAKPVALVPPAEPLTPVFVDQPSVVLLGPMDAPVLADAPWKQRGRASWYGKNFNGRRTASGERFSAAGFTAAHRTLPIPSYVRVRRVASGQEVIVRINDRGPFHSARVLDLSYAAAQKLGMVALGSAEVEIERLTDDDLRAEDGRRGEPRVVIP